MQKVGKNPAGPRKMCAKELALITATTEYEVYAAANLTAHNWLQFPNCPFDAETEATSCSVADT